MAEVVCLGNLSKKLDDDMEENQQNYVLEHGIEK